MGGGGVSTVTRLVPPHPPVTSYQSHAHRLLQIGWFPSNYTQEEIDDPHTYCIAENVLDVMVALYPFKAQSDTELSFSKGDRLEILDRPASDPEWFKVCCLFVGESRVRSKKSIN